MESDAGGKKVDDDLKEQLGGSRLSKFFFFASWFILLCVPLSFFWRVADYDPQSGAVVSSRWMWEGTVACAIAWLCTAYLSYRLAGGRYNPIIWEGKSLFGLLKNAFESGEARIGFHSLRDQRNLLTELSSAGIRKGAFKDTRQFLREEITNDPPAFEICRDFIVFQMIHQGREMFWNGYGKEKDVQFFYEAEIIVDLKSSTYCMFRDVLEGLTEKNHE
ncbi:MAG: hypothetical protein JXN61_15705 [Sedimentisphaerales bacterium]|nr:hypothetical protein [Sedimentisphaerales bacterium]